MTAIYGCYVNDQKEIVAQFRQSTGMMSENEGEKYFGLLKRVLSGSIGKNLIDVCFKTAQVASGAEHKFLMDLRKSELKDETLLQEFYQKVIGAVSLDMPYLILLGCDRYDVPFRGKDDGVSADQSDETYQFLLCAICPVKQSKPGLQYIPQEGVFHDGGISNVVAAPELGFLFPAFDNRATNIYNALYYTHSSKENHQALADALFQTELPKPAAEQKLEFEALLSNSLDEECSMDVIQTVHDQICQRIALHKEAKVPEPLLLNKEEVKEVLTDCGVSQPKIAKFSVDYDEAFGFEAELHPKNIIDDKHFDVRTPDISIRVAPERADLVETRVIGGVKYILIQADDEVEVNGVRIHIGEKEPTTV